MRFFWTIVAAVAVANAGAAIASDGPARPAPPVRPGPVTWLTPSVASPAPQSDAEKKLAQQNGRALPTPELLQPTLDPGLPAYLPTRGPALRATLRAGSSDVLPSLVQAWVRGFRRYHPGFNLTIERPMAGSLGALELIKGNLDLVFVSRELKPTDISGFRDRFGYAPFSVPISGGSWRHFGFLDAMAIMVHPSNPIAKLSFRQLDAALSATRHRGGREARVWGDLGLTGEWADKPIHLHGIQPWNGFEEFIRQRVLSTGDRRGEWSERMAYDPTFFNVARRVADDPYALGYTGLSAIDSQVKIVPVSVADDGAPLSPDYQNVASAAYPLSRLIYFNTNGRSAAGRSPAMREFLRFILSREGQAIVREHGIYLPLRAGQVADSRAYAARD